MPVTREPTADELAQLEKEGVDTTKLPKQLVFMDESPPSEMTTGKASLAQLKAHGGSILGGGGGALGTGALLTALGLAPETFGGSLLAAIPIAAVAMGTSYLGQKGQEAIQGEELTKKLETEAQAGREAHPLASAATEIGASAIASGGWPSIGTPLKAGRGLLSAVTGKGISEGERLALGNIAMQSAINPAINSGLQLATTGQLPTRRDLLEQAVGGAAFAGHNPFLGKVAGRPVERTGEITEPTPEPNKDATVVQPTSEVTPPVENPFGQLNPSVVPPKTEPTVRPAATTKDILGEPNKDAKTPKVDDYTTFGQMNRGNLENKPINHIFDQEFEVGAKPEELENPLDREYIQKYARSRLEPYIEDLAIEELKEAHNTNQSSDIVKYLKTGKPNPADFMEAVSRTGIYPESKNPEMWKVYGREIRKAITDAPHSIDNQILKEYLFQANPEIEDAVNRYRIPMTERLYGFAHEKLHEAGFEVPNRVLKDPQEWADIRDMVAEKEPELAKWIDRTLFGHEGDVNVAKYGRAQITPVMPHTTDQPTTIGNMIGLLNKSEFFSDHPVTELLNNLGIDAKTLQTPIYYDTRPVVGAPVGEGARSAYEHRGQIRLNPLAGIHEVAEEIVHAATTSKLPSHFYETKNGRDYLLALDSYQKNGKNESIRELIKLYRESASKLGLSEDLFGNVQKGTYGLAGNHNPDQVAKRVGHPFGYHFANLDEFIASGMKEKDVQKWMNETQANDGKSLWTKFVDIVRRMIGLDVKQGSILEQVLKHAGDLASQEREQSKLGGNIPTNRDFTEVGAKRKEGGKLADFFFRPMIDRIRNIEHPMADKVANAFEDVLKYRERYRGRLLTPIIEKGKGLSEAQLEGLSKVARMERENPSTFGTAKFTNKKMQEVYDQAVSSLKEHATEGVRNNEPQYINGKPVAPSGQAFWPTQTDAKVAQVYREQTDPAKIAKMDKVFTDYQQKLGATPGEALTRLQQWKQSVQGTSALRHADNKSFFYSQRHAQGLPLPPEFTKKGFLKNLESYFTKQSTSRGFYKFVEANHDVMGALGERQDPWGKDVPPQPSSIGNAPDVRAQLDQIRGETAGSQGFHNERAASALATTLFIGPGTTVHKVISNIVGLSQYADNPYQMTRMLGNILTNYKTGLQHATENGVVKTTAKSWTDMLDSSLNFAERMQGLAKAVKGVYSLSDLTDKFGAGLMQAGLEGVLPEKIKKANNGDTTNRMLLERLDNTYTPGKTYTKEGISHLASDIVNSIQGTGDGRTMPTWMSHDSELAGFFRLSNWGISQTNRFMSDIYRPATRGDFAPLITALFGSAVGGYLIKELREQLQGKKGQIPSLSEIQASSKGLSGNIPLIGYNLMASLSYAGFGGMLTQMAKVPFDWVHKNQAQGMVFPFDELASDTIHTLGQTATAIANDPNLNWLELTKAIAGHFLTTNFQLGRVAYNQAINHGLVTGLPADKKMLADKMGQLRRFDMTEGLPYNEQDIAGNPYMNLEQRKFKLEQNPQEAIAQLVPLINKTIETYRDRPDVMMSKLKSLKTNSYSTFPSMEDMPISFMKYLNYLTKLEGPQQANAALLDYMKHRTINEIKSGLVP